MADAPHFLFVTCQVGAEKAVKGEAARQQPPLRFAFSRPGFLTFKLPVDEDAASRLNFEATFARAWGFSLGQASGEDQTGLARSVWEVLGNRSVRRVHVWARDAAAPGQHSFEPSITPEALAAREAILQACPTPRMLAADAALPDVPAKPGETVLDCVLVGTHEWWVGYHRAGAVPTRWPGGMMPLTLPARAVSRAWLKMEEALRWSELPIPRGARCAEIGSAPGGASQALLARGLEVIGIDPAEMAPIVLGHPKFTHIRRKVAEVRRRDFRKVRWLTVDMNVAPQYTLDAVEAIVVHPELNIRGMLLTLKLFDWEMADGVPAYLQRIQGWGFNQVRARQLQYNRREICVSALQKPFRRKPPPH